MTKGKFVNLYFRAKRKEKFCSRAKREEFFLLIMPCQCKKSWTEAGEAPTAVPAKKFLGCGLQSAYCCASAKISGLGMAKQRGSRGSAHASAAAGGQRPAAKRCVKTVRQNGA